MNVRVPLDGMRESLYFNGLSSFFLSLYSTFLRRYPSMSARHYAHNSRFLDQNLSDSISRYMALPLVPFFSPFTVQFPWQIRAYVIALHLPKYTYAKYINPYIVCPIANRLCVIFGRRLWQILFHPFYAIRK